MRLKIIAMVFLGLLATVGGCNAERLVRHAKDNDNSPSVNYPPKSSLDYPEDQVVKKEIQVTTQWQTIAFKKPLIINRLDLQHLHLAVDQAPYISTMDTHALNPECNEPECAINGFCLRRLSDGVVIRPDVILIGDNGVEVKVRSVGHLYPYFDKNIITMMIGTFKLNGHPPPFPVGITAFTAMRIRSTEPFLIRYLYWNVDYHSYYE
jgi:hypothetical protein